MLTNNLIFYGVFNRHEIETHGRNFNRILGERDEFGYFYCRAGCENVFLTKATRNRLEKMMGFQSIMNFVHMA